MRASKQSLSGCCSVKCENQTKSYSHSCTHLILQPLSPSQDADTELTGGNGKCFVLQSSQGWITDMINVPTKTDVGETTRHAIPIGQFFTGTVNYLAYLQDSDGSDRSLGESSLSDLSLVRHDTNTLKVDVGGNLEAWENVQHELVYDGGVQDTADHAMSLSEDGTGYQVNGNSWKAVGLSAPYDVTPHTVLEFDVVVDQSADFHMVCLLSSLDVKPESKHCVVLQNPVDGVTQYHHLTTKLVTGQPRRVVLPYGQFLDLKGGESYAKSYLAIVEDNDGSDRSTGRSTWSHFRIYEEDRTPVVISVYGEDVTVPNIQQRELLTVSCRCGEISPTLGTCVLCRITHWFYPSFLCTDMYAHNQAGDHQDNRDYVLSVSSSGKAITASGNNWKYFDVPLFNVTSTTVLEFDFELSTVGEIHFLCLADTLYTNDGRNDCWSTAGTQSEMASYQKRIYPYGVPGRTHYTLMVGDAYFTGPVSKIVIGLDNDADKTAGLSTWSNIEIWKLPDLKVGLDSSNLVIENVQKSYGSSQDTTPIADHMVIISDDGSSATQTGNMWRAFELPAPLPWEALGDFVLSFDFELIEAGEIHSICFEENLQSSNAANPTTFGVDPIRCVALAYFQDLGSRPGFIIADHQTPVGGSHHYVLKLSDLFDRKYYDVKYIVFMLDNDADTTVGEHVFSNITISTSISSCLASEDFTFDLSDCTVGNFMAEVQVLLDAKGCSNSPLVELMALFDVDQDMEVHKSIEEVCSSTYGLKYEFDEVISTERQLVKEFLDGGTTWNYANSDSLESDVARIDVASGRYATSQLLSWPNHHALENCDVGAAMCCYVSNRKTCTNAECNDDPIDNTDVCYVNMKESRYSAHVRDGWSIYTDAEEPVFCKGFAWGTDDGSIDSALKGNALFQLSFVEQLMDNGNVEQVPGAPLCGCVSRMPVVTSADCMDASADSASVTVSYNSALLSFDAALHLGSVSYGDCGGKNLVDYYATLTDEGKASDEDLAYMQKRIVGEGGCNGAINDFLATKGLVLNT